MVKGLTNQQAEESRKQHGSNQLTVIPPDPLWKKILEGFKDPMILILCVALAVQVVLCFMGQAEWYEPVGVLIAIMIANGVASVSENKQENVAAKYQLFYGGEDNVFSQVGGGDLFWGFKHNWRHYFGFMHELHSGVVNDYALWAVVALALAIGFMPIVL